VRLSGIKMGMSSSNMRDVVTDSLQIYQNVNMSHLSLVGFDTVVNSRRNYENNRWNCIYRLSIPGSKEDTLKLCRY